MSRFVNRHKVSAHLAKLKPDLAAFCERVLSFKMQTQNVCRHLNLWGEPWGRKPCRLKERGRRASPLRRTPPRNAGRGTIFIGVSFCSLGSASESCSEENHTYRGKRRSKAGPHPELDYIKLFESYKKATSAGTDNPINFQFGLSRSK